MTVPPVTRHAPNTSINIGTCNQGYYRGQARRLKVRTKKNSCKKEAFNCIYYAAALPKWLLVYGDRVRVALRGGRLNSTI
ncbi:hypothetical protein PILCRDRAFT_818732 [Piloderma croceum F 1598]|uniref:Uncharacterized protein n=1 Tax=Piloderma croceum (strain F 1598) TaxID=765440 RepID=A0A0C3BDG9_PILCF|nr:hypothetical protein PILCRDRAFT_818732 [Piloderma croceum F 1598]